MLGYVQGKVIAKDTDTLQCVILSQGLGYEVSLPKPMLDTINLHETVSLWIHTVVREDAFRLYGFRTEAEKHFFRALLGVSGLGPKSALSLLGEHGADRLAQLIFAKNAGDISSAPGVGKKTAQRIVLDLEPKIQKWGWVAKLETRVTARKTPEAAKEDALRIDLSSALANLGYIPAQIKNVLEKLLGGSEEKIDFESALKLALKELSGRAMAQE